IPTKVLAHRAYLYHTAKSMPSFGLEGSLYRINWSRVQERKNTIVTTLRKGVEQLLKVNDIEVIRGQATLTANRSINISSANGSDGKTVELASKKIIIASGSTAAAIPGVKIDEEKVLSSSGALNLKAIPNSIAIIGGGVIGLEFASIFNTLGSKVVVIELLPRLLPAIDAEITELLCKELQKQGVQIYTGAAVEEVTNIGNNMQVVFTQQEQKKQVTATKVLLATGRLPRISGLVLERAGIEHTSKGVTVNKHLETNCSGIFAAGDIIGGYQLAHVAFAEGEIAALNACAQLEGAAVYKEVDYRSVPACVYTNPEVAQVGLSEAEARQQYGNIKIGRFPLAANGKAFIEGQTAGIIKVICEPAYGEIMGVCLIGPHATELIAEAALAINNEITIDALVDTIHAHPTVSEIMREAGLVALGRPLHIG
ncbi:MAG: dihydrolipoyl dehydrogenase, partial [Clostridia bacterium]|nr:dihydrolipoyl dehydrogenase [Clostridia bacterium]